MKIEKVTSMGYDISNDQGEFVGYAKKVGHERYRVEHIGGKLNYRSSPEGCAAWLAKQEGGTTL